MTAVARVLVVTWSAKRNQPMTMNGKLQVLFHEILVGSVSLSGSALIIWLIWIMIRHPVFWFVTVPGVFSLIWILPRCIDPDLNWQPNPEQNDAERREYLKRVTRIEP